LKIDKILKIYNDIYGVKNTYFKKTKKNVIFFLIITIEVVTGVFFLQNGYNLGTLLSIIAYSLTIVVGAYFSNKEVTEKYGSNDMHYMKNINEFASRLKQQKIVDVKDREQNQIITEMINSRIEIEKDKGKFPLSGVVQTVFTWILLSFLFSYGLKLIEKGNIEIGLKIIELFLTIIGMIFLAIGTIYLLRDYTKVSKLQRINEIFKEILLKEIKKL
jgi:hypothetical protein